MTTTFRFRGQPRVGQFLKAPRGRTAYEIVGIKLARGSLRYIAEGDTVGPTDSVWRGTFTVARWDPCEVPPEATVHEWRWDKR